MKKVKKDKRELKKWGVNKKKQWTNIIKCTEWNGENNNVRFSWVTKKRREKKFRS